MNVQDKNYLLFVPSILTSDPQSMSYKVEGMEAYYVGMQTNEAVTKYLVDYLDKKNMKLDKIIMLCTEEVEKKEMPAIGGRTTLAYYKDVICEFLAQNDKYSSRYTETEKLFEEISYFASDYEVNEIRKSLDAVMRITEEGEENARKHLYVDFTGGPRSAALTLVFTCRILQRSKVAVEKILYSNIIKTEEGKRGKIEECTKVYNVFAELEAVEALVHNDSSKVVKAAEKTGNRRVIDNVKKLEAESSKREEANQVNQLETMGDASKGIVDVAGEIANEDNSLLAHLITGVIGTQVEKSKKLIANPEYKELIRMEELLEKDKNKALSIFREKAIKILTDFGIIEGYKEEGSKKLKTNAKTVTEDTLERARKRRENLITNEIMAAYCYYESPVGNKSTDNSEKAKSTFMNAVQDYVKLLNKSPEREPVDILNEKNIKFYDLKEYIDIIPEERVPRRFAHNDYSKDFCNKKILPYLKADDSMGADVGQLIRQYQKMDRVYMGYGFPFACTYASWFFDGYEKLYRENMKRGAESLQRYFMGVVDERMGRALAEFPEESFTYQTLIRELQWEPHKKNASCSFPVSVKE